MQAKALAVVLLTSTLLGAITPRAADAMCCLCRTCAGAAFCADAVANSVVCATLCLSAGCSSTLYDSIDVCAGGCDGGSVAPTVTPSHTPSATPSSSPTATATLTETPTHTQAVVGTATSTPSATPSSTVTPNPQLSGHVLYYTDDRPVPGVDLALIGGSPATAMTDTAGAYGFFAGTAGAQTLQPTKQDDFRTAVTALDASFVLEYVAGLRSLNSDQLLAADVTGDGTVSALDGTRILQFAAGLLTRFAVAHDCGSDWVFRPDPVVVPGQSLVQPQIGGMTCVKGAIAYDATFAPPASGQDFVAILFGDVTGNWDAP